MSDHVGVAGLYAFAFFAWLSTSGAALALAIVVVTFAVSRPAWSAFRASTLLSLWLAFTAYLLIRTVWASWEFPDTAAVQWRQAWAWFQLWFFVCVAWRLGENVERMNWIFGLALAGLLLGMLLKLDWSRLAQILTGSDRSGINTHPNPFSLYVSTALLGVAVLAPRLWGRNENRATFLARVTLWFIALVLLIEWLVLTQTRAAWLAVALVFPVVLLLRLTPWLRSRPEFRRRRIALIVAGTVLAAAAIAANLSVIKGRLSQEHETSSLIASGELENLPRTSIAYRVHLYRFGLEKWLERPLFGWGPGSVQYLVSHSGREELKHPTHDGEMDWLDHLHNTYIELLVRFGLVGALLGVALAAVLVVEVRRAWRSGHFAVDHALFLFGGFGLTAIWSMFDFRLDHFDWRYYWLLLAGAAVSCRLHPRSGTPRAQRLS